MSEATAEVNEEAQPEEVDVSTLSKNDKYLAILTGVKQSGPFFFTTTNPDDLALDESDPIRLAWTSLIANWKILCLVLGQFEAVLLAEAEANKEGAEDESSAAEDE